MTGWATCLNCAEPVPGAHRHEARLCRRRCLEEGLRELSRIEAQLDLTRFADDSGSGMTGAVDGMTQLHRRSLLLHAVAAWEQTDGDVLAEAVAATASADPPAPAAPTR